MILFDDSHLPSLHSLSASPIYPGKQMQDMVLSGRESTTTHSALTPHGLVSVHGFLHLPLKQANLLGQSASILHSDITTGWILHDTNGFPMYPGGHEHCGLWLLTEQMADKPHLHGSSQRSFLQAKLYGHSLSVVHSGLSHRMKGSPLKFSGQ